MQAELLEPIDLNPATRVFYAHAVAILNESSVSFLIGGSYASHIFTGIAPQTKDLDVFVRRADSRRALDALAAAGYLTELTFPHWLGKVFCGEDFIDVIFSSGNGLCDVDDAWFEHAIDGTVLDLPVKLCPPEEMVWQKCFIMERERFDGADVAHLLRACADRMDWPRLLQRFGPHWRVLLAHLVLFGFIYPANRSEMLDAVVQELLRRLQDEVNSPVPQEECCLGTLLSRSQYLIDVRR